jgi:hypothetical protein
MTIASVLVQPQRLTRVSADANVRLMDDVGRMIALLVEDAATEGPVAQALLDAAAAVGPRMQQELETRLRTVASSLRIRAQALVTSLEGFGDDIADIGDDPAKATVLAGRLLTLLGEGLDALTYPGLRERVQFVVNLLEQDLGLSAAFIEAQILAFLNDAADRITALDDGGDAAVRRQRRACSATLRRLGRFLQTNFHFPGLDVDGLTRALYKLLQDAGIQEIVRQARCALTEFDAAIGGAAALGAAIPGIGARSVSRAALVELSGQPVYAWYPSWLLSDEDLLLLGLSDFKNAARLIVTIRDSSLEAPVFLREKFTPAQLATFAGVTSGTEPTEEQKLIVLAVLNKVIQGPLVYDSERFPVLAPSLPNDLKEEQLHAIEKNDVLLANRHFICHVFRDDLEDASGAAARFFAGLGRTIVEILFGEPAWPRHQVSVSADRRFIMCDDMPLLMGENLKWYDAPIFSEREYGQTFWTFEHVSPNVCEGFAHHLAWPATLGKAVWHLVRIILDQPGHRVGSSIAVSLEFAEALNQLIFGRPINGYAIGDWGKWLSSGVVGPRALAILGGSFQGTHTAATGGNIFLFWLTMYLGDVIRNAGPASITNSARSLVLGILTLVNHGGPRDGPSTLPDHPAQNHLKQGPINSLVNALYGMWLLSYYKREDHSIFIWSAGGIGDRRERAFALWLGGGIGMGIFAGFTTSLVSQIMAWAEDWALLGKTIGIASAIMVLQFWFLEYLLKEGDTDGGTYNPRGPTAFAGYKNKDTSPYRLPFPGGVALYCGQGNQGMWSHNDIANIGAAQQCYAFDFGHDHQQVITAARGGIVWAFNENNADNSTAAWNAITILHDANDADHDDPFGTGPVTTYGVYGHGAFNGITNAFASRGLPPPTQESASPGAGTRVNQGDVIMLADDTGTSFHSHLHMHVLMDISGTVVAPGAATGPGTVGIPFVFRDVRGEGRCINLTWYESENA